MLSLGVVIQFAYLQLFRVACEQVAGDDVEVSNLSGARLPHAAAVLNILVKM